MGASGVIQTNRRLPALVGRPCSLVSPIRAATLETRAWWAAVRWDRDGHFIYKESLWVSTLVSSRVSS